MPDYVKLFLEEVEGRELITEAIQYGMKLVIASDPEQKEALARTYSSLSQGRKVFRLFRFIPETLRACETDLTDIDSILEGLKHASSAIFYVIDHYVWIVQFAIKTSKENVAVVKKWKHRASIIVSVFAILVHIRRMHSLAGEAVTLNKVDSDIVKKDIIKILHNSVRLLLSVHKLDHLLSRNREEWTEKKSGTLGLLSALLGMANRAISNSSVNR